MNGSFLLRCSLPHLSEQDNDENTRMYMAATATVMLLMPMGSSKPRLTETSEVLKSARERLWKW